MAWIRRWLTGLLGWLLLVPWVQASIDLQPLQERGSLPLSQGVEVLVDEQRRWRFDEVRALADWQPLNGGTLNAGFDAPVHWLRTTLVNTGPLAQAIVLEVGYPLLDHIRLEVRTAPDATWQYYDTGDQRPFAERPIDYPAFAFPLDVPAGGSLEILLRVESSSSMQVPLRVWDPVRFTEFQIHKSLLFGVLVGMLVIMAVYNLFLFIALQDRSYFFFALALTSYALVEMTLSGTAYAYLWPTAVDWNDKALLIAANLSLFGLARFSIHFLDLSRTLPPGRYLLDGLGLISLGVLLASLFLPYRLMIQLTAALVAGVPIVAYVSGMYLWLRRGFVPARYYGVAFTFYVASAALFVLSKFGWLPRTGLTEYGIHVGSVSFVALLSFALADRVNRAKLDKEAAQRDAIEHLEKFRLIYENALEGLYRLNDAGQLLTANPAFAQALGAIDEADLLRRVGSLEDLVPADAASRRAIWRELQHQGQVLGFEAQCRRLDGQLFWASLFARRVCDPQTGQCVIEGSLIDISDRKRSEERLQFLAQHDPLTRLLNRTEMESRLRRALLQVQEEKARHVFLFLDLDQFKIVNDTCGHRAGDELLRQLAEIFRRHGRSRDALARLGGDEFGLLFEHCSLEDALEIAEQLRKDVNEFRFHWNDRVFRVGASIGLVALRAELKTVDEILALADLACYAAKDQGRNQVVVHRQDSGELSRRQSDMGLVATLREAVQQDRFVLYFQRILPCARPGGGGERLEILVRLQDNGELMAPGRFLPVAERYNVIAQLDVWVVRRTLTWLRDHPDRRAAIAQVNINLSGQTIGNPEAMAQIVLAVDDAGVPGDKLCFEITEHAAITNLRESSEFVTILRGKGVRFALDDFGSGFASYSHLKHLPVTSLKIDGAFVRDINQDPFDLAMVRSIKEIAHTMGLSVVAEFVEDQEILDTLRHMGIDYAQGFHLHQPEPLEGL